MQDLPFERDLFDILVCPESRVPLKWTGEQLVSTDPAGRRAYRVDDGVPVMLIEESEVLDPATWQRLIDGPGPVGAGVAAVCQRRAPLPDA